MIVKEFLMNLMNVTPRDEYRRLCDELEEATNTLERISDEVRANAIILQGSEVVRASTIRAILAGVPDDKILRTREDIERYFTE